MGLKRPDGAVVEEYITSSYHLFENGKLSYRNNDPEGEYTGRFLFVFRADGKDVETTRWYTEATAPKWLLALYYEARGETEQPADE